MERSTAISVLDDVSRLGGLFCFSVRCVALEGERPAVTWLCAVAQFIERSTQPGFARLRALRRAAAVAALLSLWTALVAPSALRAAAYSEEAVKAAFLYRFAAYVQWPHTDAIDHPFTIGTVGADAVTSQLSRLVAGKRLQGRPAEALAVHRTEDLNGVQILYFGPGAASREPKLIAEAAARSILVVTDEENGLKAGGVINFLPTSGSVRFEVSLPAAERSGLKIDSGLLSVAARVEGRPGADLLCPSQRSEAWGPARCATLPAPLLAIERQTSDRCVSPLIMNVEPRCDSCS
jgi:hypothetical protein